MRIGLVGLGRIGAFDARTLAAALPAVDALVITDADPAGLGAVSAAAGAEPEPDLAALFAAGIDGLVVAASTAVHPALIRAGGTVGPPMFCEKPVAGDLAEAAELSRELPVGCPAPGWRQSGWVRCRRFAGHALVDVGGPVPAEASRPGRRSTSASSPAAATATGVQLCGELRA
jgi:hypothetical protein